MKHTLSVGIVLVLVAAPVSGQTPEQKKATIAYLQKLQNKDGGFRPSAAVETSSLRATSSALRALKYFGGEVPDRAAAAEFVKKCHDKASGGFADEPRDGNPNVVKLLHVLVELRIPTESYEAGAITYLDENVKTFDDIRIAVAGLEAIGKKSPQNDRWSGQVAKLANRDFLFGTGDGVARDTGGSVVALLRMRLSLLEGQDKDIVRALDAGQRRDGGFGKAGVAGSDLESSYRVLRCYHMLKKQPERAAALREFVAKCRNDDGGYGVAPGEKSAVGSTYFGSIILHWLDEK